MCLIVTKTKSYLLLTTTGPGRTAREGNHEKGKTEEGNINCFMVTWGFNKFK